MLYGTPLDRSCTRTNEPSRIAMTNEITLLLEKAREGDASAWDRVVHLLYEDLRELARRASPGVARQDATALVHECYMKLSRSGAEGIVDRAHFLSLASMAMRRLIINHARDRVATKRGGGRTHTTLGKVDIEASACVQSDAEDLLEIDDALRRLGEIDPRLVKIVELRFFAGLSAEETAIAMGDPLRTSQRLWQEARTQLRSLLDQPA